MQQRIAVMGASGSVGQQTLDIIANNSSKYQLVAFSVNNNIAKAQEILQKNFQVEMVVVGDEAGKQQLQAFGFAGVIAVGAAGLTQMVNQVAIEKLIIAISGVTGLVALETAIKKGITIGLANKESLVIAGAIIMPLARKHKATIIPVDSEHAGIYQILDNNNSKFAQQIASITVTASGGSLRDVPLAKLGEVTADQALKHPNWAMGQKITIESATMINKGFEVIEAHHLFGLPYEQIKVLIHPQSITHGLVEFNDGSWLSQLGVADMRIPIQYALSYPRREPVVGPPKLDWNKVRQLDFQTVIDQQRYPCYYLALQAGKTGHSMPTVLHAANEIAIDLFLRGKITYDRISVLIAKAMQQHNLLVTPSIEQLLVLDQEVKKQVLAEIEKEKA